MRHCVYLMIMGHDSNDFHSPRVIVMMSQGDIESILIAMANLSQVLRKGVSRLCSIMLPRDLIALWNQPHSGCDGHQCRYFSLSWYNRKRDSMCPSMVSD